MKEAIDHKKNGLDFIRYYATISVMLLHFTTIYLLRGHPSGTMKTVALQLRFVVCAIPGVVILFALSGFLTMASMERETGVYNFFKNRVFRIYPSLWIATSINIIVIVLLVPKRLDSSFLVWIVTQIPGIANTPACLEKFGTGSVNGALWTVLVQVQLYVFLAVFYPFLKKCRAFAWSFLIIFVVGLNVVCQYLTSSGPLGEGIVPKLIERSFGPYLMWFLLGAALYKFRDFLLPVLKKIWWLGILILLLIQGKIIPDYGYYAGVLTGLITPCVAIGLGYCLPVKRLKDCTYELFLTHWIMLNVIMHFKLFRKWPIPAAFVLFIVGTMFLVAIEKWIAGRLSGLYRGKLKERKKNHDKR